MADYNEKFERLIPGNKNTEKADAIAIWNSIASYNFLQTAKKSNARISYYGEYYEKSLPNFWTVLDELISDIVIVWGRKVWGYLPIEGLVSSMTVLREDSVVSLLLSPIKLVYRSIPMRIITSSIKLS